MSGWVLHVDLDQFIAAVEVLRRPELAGLPVVVGGDGDPTKHGVVATATYEAREFGVQSGLPLRTAVRRCPDAVFLPVDREAYEEASEKVMATLRTFDAVVEVMGWDEAFMAVDTDDPQAYARRVQERVRDSTHLDCTVGVGQNKLQAKLATGFGKPAGVFTITDQTWFDVLGELRTDALWGIGAKTARRLAGLGIRTVDELAGTNPRWLAEQVGPTTGPWLVRLARGRDSSPVVSAPYVARGRSREHTFQHNLQDWEEVRHQVAELARQVADDVRAQQRQAVRVVTKVRFAPFMTHTHGHALATPTADAAEIERAALAALEKFTQRRPVRLLGVRAEMVMPGTEAPPQEVTDEHSP